MLSQGFSNSLGALPTGLWRYGAGIAGNVFALGLFLSPIPTFRRIYRNKSTEQFSGMPYIFALLNCLICTWYGLPIVSHNNILVATVNGTGALFQIFYISLYIAYAPQQERIKVGALVVVVISIVIAIVVMTVRLMKQPLRMMFVGSLSVVSLVSMFASPLSIIVWPLGIILLFRALHYLHRKLVIETRSAEYMPFYLSLSTFLMSTSFFAYGILGRDPFVYVPNGIGSLLGIVQLALYVHYSKAMRRGGLARPFLS